MKALYEEGLIHRKGCQAQEQVAKRGCQSPSFEVFKTQQDKAMINLL